MQRITRDKITVVFDHHLPPVARVRPGETFVVETEDSRSGRTRTAETTTPEFLLAMRRQGYYGNPVTGPIYVEGAEPGDTLAVHIHAQECDTLGYMGYWPFLFHLEDFFDKPDTTLVEIRDGYVILSDDVHIPVRPVIGTIGTTPAVEAILSGGMGRHGGNLDTQEVCAGSTIYLPVYVEGALLALGDCHAIQSDGELNEVEMRSVVTLSCDVVKGRSPVMSWPRIETADTLVTVAVATPLEEATRLALRDMILWLEELTGLTKREAYYLVGLAGHARPGQVQVPLYSMRCLMPKTFIPSRVRQ
ncbi:MAG TPA: acetamidase/formamidase family protein [Chloroflexota bacterium]|nr:acetamidase/formamidase family protein [Chloroflexota bacterium]